MTKLEREIVSIFSHKHYINYLGIMSIPLFSIIHPTLKTPKAKR